MRTFPIVVVLVAVGCDKPKPEPTPPPPTPTPAPSPADAGLQAGDAGTIASQTACDALLVFLETGGTWIGAPPGVSCFADNTGGERDTAWFKREIQRITTKLPEDCKPSLEVAAANGVSYQDVITMIDAGMSVGFKDVELASPVRLSMKFTATKQPACDGPLATKKTAAGSGSAIQVPADLKDAVVIIVTRDAVMIKDEEIISIADASKGSNKYAIPELQRAIPAGTQMVILQADASTDAKVINRVIQSANDNGIDNVLFAIKNR